MKVDPKKLELHLARACMSEVDLRNGTSPQTLLRIRRGMEVKPKTVGKIALALGVDVIDIIENTAATKTKQSSRKYVCPVCGCIIRATKEVHVICGDCNVEFEEEA